MYTGINVLLSKNQSCFCFAYIIYSILGEIFIKSLYKVKPHTYHLNAVHDIFNSIYTNLNVKLGDYNLSV